MSFENSSISWAASQLTTMVNNGKIRFDSLIQRGLSWEKARKTLLIQSMIIGVPIPSTYARRSIETDEDGKEFKTYGILDGKQRLTTISSFINNEFSLSLLPTIQYYDEVENQEMEVDVSNCYFNQLPDSLQDRIKNARINVIYFDDLDNEEVKELFKRLNNGKPLSTKSRVLASCNDLEFLLAIGSHDLFEEMLTDKAKANKNQVSIVMKCNEMMTKPVEDITFESKVFNPIIEETILNDDDKIRLDELFNLILNTHTVIADSDNKKVAKKLYTETHMVSLVPFFKRAMEEGKDEYDMAGFVTGFFGTEDVLSISDDYNDSCAGGNARNAAIVARNDALAEYWDEFFAEMNEDTEEEVA